MAERPICSIHECDNPVMSRGYCSKHYSRFLRHGDPHKIVKRRGEARRFITETALIYDKEDCLIWPFTKTKGYGWVQWEGKSSYAHRVVCLLAHGEPEFTGAVARHSCGNGHLACVNPKHLSWGTYKDNSDDCAKHGNRAQGERQGSSKLSNSDAKLILSMKGKRTGPELARDFNVHPQTIYRIWEGTRWGWLSQ